MDDDIKEIMNSISKMDTRTLIVLAGSMMVEVNNRVVKGKSKVTDEKGDL